MIEHPPLPFSRGDVVTPTRVPVPSLPPTPVTAAHVLRVPAPWTVQQCYRVEMATDVGSQQVAVLILEELPEVRFSAAHFTLVEKARPRTLADLLRTPV